MRTMPPKTSKQSREQSRQNRRQVSLLQVFRSAFEAKEAAAARNDGDRDVTVLTKQKREGVDEAELRRHLSIDLDSLMNTIRLDSIVDMDGAPYVERSVVNYGFRDMSSLTRSHKTDLRIAESIRRSLVNHEPRLLADSIRINIVPDSEGPTQKVSFEIFAELVADPVDIPLDFVAEIDMGAGSMKMKHLRVQQ